MPAAARNVSTCAKCRNRCQVPLDFYKEKRVSQKSLMGKTVCFGPSGRLISAISSFRRSIYGPPGRYNFIFHDFIGLYTGPLADSFRLFQAFVGLYTGPLADTTFIFHNFIGPYPCILTDTISVSQKPIRISSKNKPIQFLLFEIWSESH